MNIEISYIKNKGDIIMATIDLGKVAFTHKGIFASGTTYEEKDVVQYTDGDITYICLHKSLLRLDKHLQLVEQLIQLIEL